MSVRTAMFMMYEVPITPMLFKVLTPEQAQILIYNGPDRRYQGKELAFQYNESANPFQRFMSTGC